MTHKFTPLQRTVIDYIIAVNEEAPLPDIALFMQAIEGGFEPKKPFTLYMPTASKVLLYVAEARANTSASPRAEFNRRCEALKKPLVEIARFISELSEENYLRVEVKQHRGEPEDPAWRTHWRRYEAFYMPEMKPLIFACSVRVTPKLKLYKLAELVHS
jgi:hypothetical protein